MTELSDVINCQTIRAVEFLLYRTIMSIDDLKSRWKLKKTLVDIIPTCPHGSLEISNNNKKYYVSFKPCFKEHDLNSQLSIIYHIDKNQESFNCLIQHISQLLSVTRKAFIGFMADHEFFYDGLTKKLDASKKKIAFNIDQTNGTMYIHDDSNIRLGIFVESENMVFKQIDIDMQNFMDIITKNTDETMIKTLEELVTEYITYQNIIYSYYKSLIMNATNDRYILDMMALSKQCA